MYQKVCEEIVETALKCGRDPKEISLVAVIKQLEWKKASFLYDLGQRDFGENRIIEALGKQQQAPSDCEWHFIGNLQKNKIRKVINQFKLIHSIDSFDLAQKLSEISLENGVVTPILLQANTSGETSKHGLSPKDWIAVFGSVMQLKGIEVQGLMTMAPYVEDKSMIRSCFRGLSNLRKELEITNNCTLPHLSMGMSHDFKIAIEEGATILRIGTALF